MICVLQLNGAKVANSTELEQKDTILYVFVMAKPVIDPKSWKRNIMQVIK